MTDDDTPDPPAGPTPAAAIATLPESADADAVALLGRPTPSPDQLPTRHQTSSSSAKSSESLSLLACGDVEIGGRQQPPLDDEALDGEEREASSSGPSDDDEDDTKAAPPKNDKEDAEEDVSFVATTPLNFKNQLAALAGYADASSDEKERASNDDGTTRSFEESREGDDEMKLVMKLSPPPPCRLSTPADPFRGGDGGGLFSGSIGGSIIRTPDPLLVHSNLNDVDLLNQEVMAAAPTASAMQYRSDGFDSGWLSHQLGATTATTTPGRAFDLGQFAAAQQQQYPSMMPDPYSLPPFLQGHLDETYAASTVVFPRHPSNSDDADGGGIRDDVYFQVMAYRRNGGGGSATPGRTPPHVSSHSSAQHYVRGGGQGDASYERPTPPAGATARKKKRKKAHINKARPLPLRKRKLQVDFDGGDGWKEGGRNGPSSVSSSSSSAGPPGNKRGRALVRHNMRGDDDGRSRVTCKCSKSKCLKLYCDCFQQRKLCWKECECTGCKNTEANSGPDGLRTLAIEAVLARRPDAFEPRTRDADEGCRCKKNRCLKKYCICFNQGQKCDSRCRCKNCENRPGMDNGAEEEGTTTMTVEGGEVAVRPPTLYAEAVAPKFEAEPATSSSSVGGAAFAAKEVVSSSFDAYGEPPELPGGYTFGVGAPPSPPSFTEV